MSLWAVYWWVIHLASSHHLSSLTSAVAKDFSSFLQYYTQVSRQSETQCSHGMKKKITRNLHKEQKLNLASFFPVFQKIKIKIKKYNCDLFPSQNLQTVTL